MVAEHGADFDDVELGGLADGVFLGGYETSASMLSLGTYVLLQSPRAWAMLRRGDPAEVDRVVEELLRFVCPVQIAFPASPGATSRSATAGPRRATSSWSR